ncbi:MAG: stage II sporulation protein M, partial [Pseudomonadota bacterium]
EAEELAGLYRNTVNALSLAREISLDRALLTYLEALAARAYLAVYAPRADLAGLVWRLLSVGIPRAVRRVGTALGLAALALFLGAATAYLLYLDDPSWFSIFVPPGLAGGRGPQASEAELRAVLSGTGGDVGGLAAFAGYLFSHNTMVAIFVFSLGILACAPSLLLTFYNGLILGVFAALHVEKNLGYELFAWLSVHGVTELAAIVIACAGGVHLGLALLFPGETTRADALRRNGRDAVKLAILAGLMLVVAAILEGFFRQLVQAPPARLAIGWGIGLLWLLWLSRAGRADTP